MNASGAGRHGRAPTNSANLYGCDVCVFVRAFVRARARVCVCICVCARAYVCARVCACVMCLQYTIIIFDPGG